MQQYVYDPPAGSPPFEFMHNGGPIAVQPPDKFWKREVVEHTIGVKLDYQGNVKQEVKRPRTIWVPDEEKNAAAIKSGLKPDNTVWLTKGRFKAAKSQKYAPLNKYLTPVQDADKAFRKSSAERDAAHRAEMEKLEKQFELEKQAFHDLQVKEIQEMKSSFKATIKAVADEIGVDTKLLEDALQKQREALGKHGKTTVGREKRREGREILEDQGVAKE